MAVQSPYKDQKPFKTVIKDGWQILGPGGGGTMFTPTVSPHDPDTALITCDMTAAYITHDGGESWMQLNLKNRVDAIAFDPVNPGIIYAGSSGLFRSEDNGRRWSLIFPDPVAVKGERFIGDEGIHMFLSDDSWPGGRIQAIRVDPEKPDRIFLGIGLGFDTGYKADELLIYISENSGRNWIKGFTAQGSQIKKIYADPASETDNRSLYVFTDTALYKYETGSRNLDVMTLPGRIDGITGSACGMDPVSGKPVFFLLTKVMYDGKRLLPGIMRSLDLGCSWEEMHTGLDNDFHGPENGQSRRFVNISVCENDCRTGYIAIWRAPEIFREPKPEMNYQGIMKTEDMGQSWKWVQKAGSEYPENLGIGWQERRYDTDWMATALFMDVCAANPDICYYTSMGTVARTADGGKTWDQLYENDFPDGMVSGRCTEVTTCYGVHFDPFDRDHLVISYTDIGMFQSWNGGKSWQHTLDGVPESWINTCYWMVFDPEVKGKAWSVWSNMHDLPRAKLFRNDHFEHFNRMSGVCKSDNGVQTWYKCSDGIPEDGAATHIVMDPGSPAGSRTLYAAVCGKGVYKSTDDGNSWVLKNNGITGTLFAWRLVLLPDNMLYLLVMRSSKNNRVLPGAIYKSNDSAESWEEVSMPEGTNFPNDLVFDPSRPDRMYLACWPETIDGEERNGGVYLTEDGGRSWKNIFSRSSHVYGLAVGPHNSSSVYLANFENSLYRSDDCGSSWRRLRGYNFKWGHRPVLDPYNKEMLYITTFGSSVWYGSAEGTENAFEDIYPIEGII